MKIYLLRHAESESNALGEQLSHYGFAQAEFISQKLKELPISKVLCSSLARAKQTVKPFIDTSNVAVEYSGLLVEGQLVLDDSAITALASKRGHSTTESAVEFMARVKQAVELICDSQCDNLLVVTHGHMIREIINLLLKLPNKVRFPHDNCGLSLIELGDSVKVEYLNRALCANKLGGEQSE